VQKNEAEALRLYKSAAEKGHKMAKMRLSGASRYGDLELEQNEIEGIDLLVELAASPEKDRISTNAILTLSSEYEEGTRVPQDLRTAIRLCTAAAELGNVDATIMLADRFAEGKGVRKNLHTAVKWYRKAAESGHARAMTTLGEMYEPFNYPEAVDLYRKAAAMGYPQAMVRLGLMYKRGFGVPCNDEEAERLFRRGEKALGRRYDHHGRRRRVCWGCGRLCFP
jgi:TPR repeat protein